MRPVHWVQLLIIAFVVAFCCVFGISYVGGEGWASLSLGLEVVLTLVGTVAFAAVGLVLAALLDRISAKGGSEEASALETPAKGQLPLPVLGLIMLLLWSPWLIANFPGSSFYDTYFQIYQFYPHQLIPQIQYGDVAEQTLVSAWLVDHHPWFTTLIYGSVAWVSEQLTGTWMAGFFVFSITQALAYIVLFMVCIREFRAWGVPRGVRIAYFVLVSVVPVFPVWASCVIKDSLFGVFFFTWFIMLAKGVRTKGESLAGLKSLGIMVLLALMICLTKKTGVYIVMVTAVVGCIVYRRQWRAAVTSAFASFAFQGAVCALVMFAIVPGLVFPALHIVPGGKQEALGTVFQQTSRYAQDHDLTEEEERIIDEVVSIDAVKENYDFREQDDVKYYYNTRSYDENLERYMGLWLEQGLKDPEAYFASVMAIAGLYVAPTTVLNLRMTTVETEFYGKMVLWNPPELEGMRLGMSEAYDMLAAIPVLNLPVLPVVYALWLPALLLFVCLKRGEKLGLLFAPLAVVLLFCIIGPVFDARYEWGMILGVPVLFCMVTSGKKWCAMRDSNPRRSDS